MPPTHRTVTAPERRAHRWAARARRRAACLLAATLALTTACSSEELASFVIGLITPPPPSPIVGVADARLYLAWNPGDAADTQGTAAGEAQGLNLYSLDLVAVRAVLEVEGIPAAAADIVADARHVAWVDRAAGTVVVLEREAGERRTLFEGLEGSPRFFRLAGLVDGRLIAHRGIGLRREADAHEFILVDLATDETVGVENSWRFGTYALDGDHFALFTDLPADVRIESTELGTHLDVVELSTGERRTVAPNIRVDSSGGALFATGGVLVWQQIRPRRLDTSLMRYEFATGRSDAVLERLERDDLETTRLVGFNGRAMLLLTDRGTALIARGLDLSLHPLTGRTTRVVQFVDSLLGPFVHDVAPRLVGDLVIWTDPFTGAIMIHDPARRSTLPFDPASLVPPAEAAP